jgi:hypothetical protein
LSHRLLESADGGRGVTTDGTMAVISLQKTAKTANQIK